MKRCAALVVLLLLAGCVAVPSLAQRRAHADALAARAGWRREMIAADPFTLAAYVPATRRRAATLTVYLEGDGLAWIDPSTPSADPTPTDPLALRLALRDPSAAAYLARPCQFVGPGERRACSAKYWTSHRFAPEVIRATSQAVDRLKQRFNARRVILVGYSGGGAVAALVAAGRRDVSRLITVAGDLETRVWTQEHEASPLTGSLNPADAWRELRDIPQTHFVGGKDDVVGEAVARAYAARFRTGPAPEIVVLAGFDHHCCWEEAWPALRARTGPGEARRVRHDSGPRPPRN
ncbi:MAG: alpha/beta hydrolase [Rhodospirillales bacterium]|nr:alpha/beta hydrolase [Rhodospirillales bacterium]